MLLVDDRLVYCLGKYLLPDFTVLLFTSGHFFTKGRLTLVKSGGDTERVATSAYFQKSQRKLVEVFAKVSKS
jgi:hypothetical protein